MRQFDTFQTAFANNLDASKISWRLQHDLESLAHKYSHCVFKYVAMSEDLFNKVGGPCLIRGIGNETIDVKIAFHLHGLEYCIFFEYDDGTIPAVNANPKKIWLSTVSAFDDHWFSKALREKIDAVVERGKHNECLTYCVDDIFSTQEAQEFYKQLEKTMRPKLRIKKVIFNDPATIVFWYDGTKTVVKTRGKEKFDPEKGLAMAVSKKVFGTNESGSNYYDVLKKWIPEKPKKEKKKVPDPRKGGTK